MSSLSTISQFVPVQPGATLNVRNSYPLFLDFMKAYYEWMESQNNTISSIMNIFDQRDIDTCLNEYVIHFQKKILPSIPNSILCDKRKLVKHIRDFYNSRGSENSYRFLFRILYNENIDFYYPKIDVLRVSDGKWSVDTIIRTTTNNDTQLFVARELVGLLSGARANVENVVTFNIQNQYVSEIYLSQLTKDFYIGENIQVILPNGKYAIEKVFGIATGAVIATPGTGYQVDDVIGINDQNTSAILVVNSTYGTELGKVRAATQQNYPQPAAIQLSSNASSVNNFYIGMTIIVSSLAGISQTKKIWNYNGFTKVALVEDSWNLVPDNSFQYTIFLGKIKSLKVKDFGINYGLPPSFPTLLPIIAFSKNNILSTSGDFTISGNGDATGRITFGTVGKYPGHYINTDGFLSSNKFIQDGKYYQDFSYVLKTPTALSSYENIIKKLLHPAGLFLFGNLQLPDNDIATTRKQHILSSSVTILHYTNSLPELNLLAKYPCLVDLRDQGLLFDTSNFYPSGNNAVLGNNYGDIQNYPTFNSAGLQTFNTFCSVNNLSVNMQDQTILVVAKPYTLNTLSSPIGCIDLTNASVSGYQIICNVDGSLLFVAQKQYSDLSTENITLSYPPNSVITNKYFFASLRHGNNTVSANLNLQPNITTLFSTNTLPVLNNNRGFHIGVGGFSNTYSLSNSLAAQAITSATLSARLSTNHVTSTQIIPGFFNGSIAYVVIYDRYLTDKEISNSFIYLQQILLTREIFLNN